MVLCTLLFFAIGALYSMLLSALFRGRFSEQATQNIGLPQLLLMLLFLYVALYLQILLHEAGHLVFGLLTGYRFTSFRIGSFMWMKKEDRIERRRLRIVGTGGQCLLSPPALTDGKYPFVLYHLGGVFMNLAMALLGIGLFFLLRKTTYAAVFCLLFSILGLAIALMNGIPMRIGLIDNDGKNTLSLGKSPDALRCCWILMKSNALSSRGVRIKDMPADWFILPETADLGNSMVAPLAVACASRLMDAHSFSEAAVLIDKLLHMDTGIVGLHRKMLVCDRLYCALLATEDRAFIATLLTKEQKKFMKQMRNYPSVLRTEYACALHLERDTEKARQKLALFQKCAKTYPYECDIESERELLAIAQESAKNLQQ